MHTTGQISTHTIPKVSAAIITPPLNVIPNTDVPVTIGLLHQHKTYLSSCMNSRNTSNFYTTQGNVTKFIEHGVVD